MAAKSVASFSALREHLRHLFIRDKCQNQDVVVVSKLRVMVSCLDSMVHMERTLLTAILLITMEMDHKDMDQVGILMDTLQIITQGL